MSGITRDTPNPPGGEIVKDKNGEPNGILKNAQSLLKMDRSATAGFTEAEKLTGARRSAQALRRGRPDLDQRPRRGCGADRALPQAEGSRPAAHPRRAHLAARCIAAARRSCRRHQRRALHHRHGDDWLKFGAFKLTLDGGMTIGTAFQRHPYGAVRQAALRQDQSRTIAASSSLRRTNC